MRVPSRFVLHAVAAALLLSPGVAFASPSSVSGEYQLVSLRRASDVAGGAIDQTATYSLGSAARFGKQLQWPGMDDCDSWSTKEVTDGVVNTNDPILSDTQIPPLDGKPSSGDQRINRGLDIYCNEKHVTRLLEVDDRILIAATKSGNTYMIFERSLSGSEIQKFQHQLRDMKFHSGAVTDSWNEAALVAVSFYAEYRGAKYRFKRTAISENLLDGLGVLENADSPEDKGEGKEEATFPGYRAKESADGVLDYRPGLRSSVEKLEAITEATFTEAVTSLVLLDLEARGNPGKWIDGQIMLGANPREYLPSDEELLAAEFGDRLATYVESKDTLELIELWGGESLLPFPLKYNRFEYRHADVMGSGRFFYASKPIPMVIAL